MKDTEDDSNKWKEILCSQTGRINTVRISILLKATYKFITISIKIPMAFFNQNNVWKYSISILERALFKQDGTPFNPKEIQSLPLGVANAIASKVMELSGVEITNQTPMGQNLMDFQIWRKEKENT